MYAGKLNYSIAPKFTYADSKKTFLPKEQAGGTLLWKWDAVYDSAIDIIYELPQSCFVGAVYFSLLERSEISCAEVLIDGVLSGSYRAETGKTFSGEHTIHAGVWGRVVTLRLVGALKDIALTEPEVLGAYDDGAPAIWPAAKKVLSDSKTVAIGKIAHSTDSDEAFAADFLDLALYEELDEPFSSDGVEVRFEKAGELANEEYHLNISEEGVLIRAADRLGMLYAVNTLLQLRRDNEFLVACVEDRPDKEFRGVHIGLPKLENFEFARRLFRYVLIPLRYNTVIIEFAGAMRFDRRPEISEAWLRAQRLASENKQPLMPHSGFCAEGTLLEKEDVRRLVGFAKELGLEVIPEVQSLGHVQYLTYAYPDIAEIDPDDAQEKDLRAEDAKPDQFYHHSYCPSLDKSYEIIFDIIDEIVEVVKPQRFVHIGHDEVYQIGICPRCKNTPPDVLYENHVRTLYEYIKKKGLRTMLWADMLNRDNKYATVAARNRLPRDIVALDFIWYFYTDKDTELALLDNDYKVIVGNLYSSHFPRFSTRINREGMLGGQISMWAKTEEQAMANIGKFYDMAYLCEMLWNAGGYDERLRPVYNQIVGKTILPGIRERIRGTYSRKSSMTSDVKLPPSASKQPPRNVLRYCADAIIADNVTVNIDAQASRLIFTHATTSSMPRTAWQNILKVGEYRVDYADGSTQSIKLGYGTNVLAYNSTYGAPLAQQYYRHFGYIGTYFADPVFVGKCDDGRDVTFLSLPWDNPFPQKTISSVTYLPDDNCPVELILADIKVIRRL